MAVGLAALAAVAFRGVVDLPFVGIDDPDYVTENVQVRAGLSLHSARWALTSLDAGNWHPVTWLSHLLDVTCFGIEPAGHHVVNVLLHIGNVLLCFLLLARLTGDGWRSLVVAALFAIHPLRVESVAWVAERKDLLAGAFWLGTMLAYLRWVRSPARHRFALVLALFALGLAAKPMVVTLPFALLLLDVWPLERLHLSRTGLQVAWPVLREKLPLLALAAASSAATLVAQSGAGAVRSLAHLPLQARLANAPVAAARYVGHTFWPTDLAVFYPFPRHLELATALAAALGIAAATALAWRARRDRPWLLVGWCWFLGSLVPVIGLVQVGGQSMADRYTYLPSIGLAIALAWSLPAPAPRLRWLAAGAGALLAAVLVTATVRQVSYWRSEQVLFTHAAQVTEGNWLAEYVLGVNLERAGDDPGALAHYRRALEFRPLYPAALNGVGALLVRSGRVEEGLGTLREAGRQAPADASVLRNLGATLCALGRSAEGLPLLDRAVALAPGDAIGRYNRGVALLESGRETEALAEFGAVLWLHPDDPDARRQVERLTRVRGPTGIPMGSPVQPR